GIADHHVVETPARNEVGMPQQRLDLRQPLVDTLHQQGPAGLGQGGEITFAEGAAAQLPTILTLEYQARLGAVLAGDAGQFLRRKRVAEIRNALAQQQRSALPIVAQEGGEIGVVEAHQTLRACAAALPTYVSGRSSRSAALASAGISSPSTKACSV